MIKQCTIIMYHFIRQLPSIRYPKMKSLPVGNFINQLDYLNRHYEFVTMQDCINSIYDDAPLPDNAVLLTFDDACIEHFISVFPILSQRRIQGSFFPPVKAITGDEVLEVNKIQFILAAANNIAHLLDDVFACLDEYRSEYTLESNNYYFAKLARENRYDSREVVFIKLLLQRELDNRVRKLIVDRLFVKYVTTDERAFSRELYMDIEQLKSMVNSGMYVGAHGYGHSWLDTLLPGQQEEEVDLSFQFLQEVFPSADGWVMSYPYGAYNDSLISVLKKKNCKLGLTSEYGIAKLNKENAFTLARFDTIDFPK